MENNVEKRIYLYGLDKEHRVVRYVYIHGARLTIKEMMFQAMTMKYGFPAIENVYAVDNSYGIYAACRDAMKTNLLDQRVLFKIMLETDGIRVL